MRVASVVLAGICLCPKAASAQAPPPYVVIVDRDMTTAAGTVDLLTVERVAIALEDRVLPPARFDESTALRHTLGIAYRAAKLLWIDLPQDSFLMVVGHEVFGHGSRLRELDARGLHYHFDAPLPYGGGGAETDFDGDLLVTRADALGIDGAGIEAQNVLADDIGRQALGRGAWHHREAWQYLESRILGLRYISRASARSPEGFDPASFVNDFNLGCDQPQCTPLSFDTLHRRALLTLADPLLAYAAYGTAVSYLVRGRATSALPMIPLSGDIRYLPAVRFEMAPYGPEWSTDHDLIVGGRFIRGSVRFGDTGSRRAWGLAVRSIDVVRRERLRVDVSADIWRQPPLDVDPNALTLATGGFAAGKAHVTLGHAARGARIGVLLEGGYKSDGYVRGERVHAGPVLRVGLTVG